MRILNSRNLDNFSLFSLGFLAFSLLFSSSGRDSLQVSAFKIAHGSELNEIEDFNSFTQFSGREYFSSKFAQLRFGREVTIGKNEEGGFYLKIKKSDQVLMIESSKSYLIVEEAGKQNSASFLVAQSKIDQTTLGLPDLGAEQFKVIDGSILGNDGFSIRNSKGGSKIFTVRQGSGVEPSDTPFLVEAGPHSLTVVHAGILYELDKSASSIKRVF